MYEGYEDRENKIVEYLDKQEQTLNILRTMMKFSRAIIRVKLLSREQTNVSKTISVLVLRVLV
jgi:hypothetical protein